MKVVLENKRIDKITEKQMTYGVKHRKLSCLPCFSLYSMIIASE